MRSLFEATTVAELAEAIIAHETEPGSVERIANVLKMVKEMSQEDASEALAEEEREKESTS